MGGVGKPTSVISVQPQPNGTLTSNTEPFHAVYVELQILVRQVFVNQNVDKVRYVCNEYEQRI